MGALQSPIFTTVHDARAMEMEMVIYIYPNFHFHEDIIHHINSRFGRWKFSLFSISMERKFSLFSISITIKMTYSAVKLLLCIFCIETLPA